MKVLVEPTALLNIKVSRRGEIRRFQLMKEHGSATWSFALLEDKLKSIFSLNNEDVLKISYIDDESDEIIFNTDEEFQVAISQIKADKGGAMILRLNLSVAGEITSSGDEAEIQEAINTEKKAPQVTESATTTSAEVHDKEIEKAMKRKLKAAWKEAAKAEHKASKEIKKQHKEKEKEARKEERKHHKERKHEERRAEKMGKRGETETGDSDDPIDVNVINKFAEGVGYLYIDGNNLFFATGPLRKLTIGKKRSGAEKLISIVAQLLHKKLGTIKYSEVYFDDTQNDTELVDGFKVTSARKMGFKIADDALVDAATKLGPEKTKEAIFVTSDKELMRRVQATGGSSVRPRPFLMYAFRKLNEDPSTKRLSSWMMALIQKYNLDK